LPDLDEFQIDLFVFLDGDFNMSSTFMIETPYVSKSPSKEYKQIDLKFVQVRQISSK